MAPSAPTPQHILRTSTAQVSALAFSADAARLYAGDSTGRVVLTSTRTLRPRAAWPAHAAGVLGLQEWDARDGPDGSVRLVTSARSPPPMCAR
jgi:hypothetical protein